jgi:predicted DNA-binding protein (UPF0251 family)
MQTLTLTEAEKHLGVSRVTLWRIIREYRIPTFADVLDKRVKRIRLTDITIVMDDADRVRRGEAA